MYLEAESVLVDMIIDYQKERERRFCCRLSDTIIVSTITVLREREPHTNSKNCKHDVTTIRTLTVFTSVATETLSHNALPRTLCPQ